MKRLQPPFEAYAVDEEGNVWSSRQHKVWRKLKPWPDRYGHLNLELRCPSNRKRIQVHRLILEVFTEPCPKGMECRHLNGNPKDNRLENLRWGTSKENGQDTVMHGRSARGSRNPSAKLTEDNVKQIRALLNTHTHVELGQCFNVHPGTISDIKRNKKWAWLK